jgi:hypothetical protein
MGRRRSIDDGQDLSIGGLGRRIRMMKMTQGKTKRIGKKKRIQIVQGNQRQPNERR